MPYPSRIEKIQDQIVELYNSGLSLRNVAKKLDISTASVRRFLNLSGKKNRNFTHHLGKYTVDESFFKKIDSHKKAQILGMIYADGCIYKNGKNSVNAWSLQLGLVYSDIKYLEQVNAIMKNTSPIYTDFNTNRKPKSEHKIQITNKQPFSKLSINNHIICEDIRKLGVLPRKSLTCEFPTLDQVPDEFINSFILGYFEGDGGFCRTTIQASCSFACSKSFAEKLQQILREKIGVNSSLSPMNGDPRMLHLAVHGNKQVIILMEWLYKNSTKDLILERKKKEYDIFKQKYSERKDFLKTPEFSDQRKEKTRKTLLQYGGKLRHDLYLKDSRGQIYYSNRITRFYKKYNLNPSLASMLLNGQRPEYKGWTRPTDQEIETAKQNNTIINEVFEKYSRREYNLKKKQLELANKNEIIS